jgi:spermidine synthase
MSALVARALVFCTSAAVLVLEILAQRLLAPYLGVSLEVFTGVIGVILAGISVGAWIGGRAADRTDPARLVGPLLVAGGLTALVSPLVIDLIGPRAGSGPLAIVLVTTVGFFAPAAVLSAIPPVVVKLRLASLEETGSVVGSYSAVGTAGAIFGTFVTGFVLIAAFPTRPIVIVIGLALVAAGVAGWRILPAGLASWAALAALVLSGGLVVFDGPCQSETTYHCAQVVVDPAREGGRTLLLDGIRNSYVDVDDPDHLEFRYAEVMADVIEVTMPAGPLRVLHVGGGGFTFPAYLDAVRPGTTHRVLEIDAALVEIGEERLGLDPSTDVRVDDARRSIEGVADDSVDLVIGDAFSGLSVPWHLTTRQFVGDLAERLVVGGVYTINVIDYGDLDFARAEARTLMEVFEHVAVFAPPAYLAGQAGGNFVLAASDIPLDTGAIETLIQRRGGSEAALAGADLAEFVGDAPILRDDFAPVDQMIDRS